VEGREIFLRKFLLMPTHLPGIPTQPQAQLPREQRNTKAYIESRPFVGQSVDGDTTKGSVRAFNGDSRNRKH